MEGRSGDYISTRDPASLSSPPLDASTNKGDDIIDSRGHDSEVSAPTAATGCEVELDGICATLESVLSPLWGENVPGVSLL